MNQQVHAQLLLELDFETLNKKHAMVVAMIYLVFIVDHFTIFSYLLDCFDSTQE
jgi:hypothetical protein